MATIRPSRRTPTRRDDVSGASLLADGVGWRSTTIKIASDLGALHLHCRRAWEVLLGPHLPAPNALVCGQLAVRVPDDRRRVGLVVEHEDGLHLDVGLPAWHPEDDGLANRRIPREDSLNVLGVDVHPVPEDDQVLLPSPQVEVAILIEATEIAGSVPPVVEGVGRGRWILPVSRSDVRTANQDLPILGEANLAARERLADCADRPPGEARRSDDRRAFRESVSLHHGDTHILPALRQFGREPGPARDEEPEGTAEPSMNGPEQISTQAKREPRRDAVEDAPGLLAPASLHLTLDRPVKERDHVRYDQHAGDLLLAQRLKDGGRLNRARIHDASAIEQGVPESHRLLEEMAEGQHREHAVT